MTKTFRKISVLTLFTVSFCVFFALAGCSDSVGDSSKNGKKYVYGQLRSLYGT